MDNSQGQERGERNSASAAQNGNRGDQANGEGSSGEPVPGEGQQSGPGRAGGGNNAGNGNRGGNNQRQANNNSSAPPADSSQPRSPGQAQNAGNANGGGGADGGARGGGDGLRRFTEQLGRGNRAVDEGGPITGNGFVNWSERVRDVEQVLDSQDLRNQLTTVRERVAVFRGEYRDRGRIPEGEAVRQQILVPLTQVRVWVQEELTRRQNAESLVPLDRDPVPENYSELVRKYYEKLGSAQ